MISATPADLLPELERYYDTAPAKAGRGPRTSAR